MKVAEKKKMVGILGICLLYQLSDGILYYAHLTFHTFADPKEIKLRELFAYKRKKQTNSMLSTISHIHDKTWCPLEKFREMT